MLTTLKVRHQIQMAHRLHNLPGKCQRIHGHTWTCILSVTGQRKTSILIDYHDLKDEWNQYLDEEFDHRLVLDANDPLLHPLHSSMIEIVYPGIVVVPFNPTVENISEHWRQRAQDMYSHMDLICMIELWEGESNCAIAPAK